MDIYGLKRFANTLVLGFSVVLLLLYKEYKEYRDLNGKLQTKKFFFFSYSYSDSYSFLREELFKNDSKNYSRITIYDSRITIYDAILPINLNYFFQIVVILSGVILK